MIQDMLLDDCIHRLFKVSDIQRIVLERELLQISQFIAAGKVSEGSQAANAVKIEKLLIKLTHLRSEIRELDIQADHASDAYRVRRETLTVSDGSMMVQGLILNELSRLGVMSLAGTNTLRDAHLISEYRGLLCAVLEGRTDDLALFLSRVGGSDCGKTFISKYHLRQLGRQSSPAAALVYLKAVQSDLIELDLKDALQYMYSGTLVLDRKQLLGSFRAAFDELHCDSSYKLLAALYSAGLMGLNTPACDGSDLSCPSCTAGSALPFLHKTRSVLADNVEGESVHVSNEGVIYSSCPNVTEQSLDARISRLDCLGEKNSDRKIFLDL